MRARHSRESGNPEKHWIPDQVRNDKPNKTHGVRYIKAFNSFKRLIVNEILNANLVNNVLNVVK
jgi:hypothetical protein